MNKKEIITAVGLPGVCPVCFKKLNAATCIDGQAIPQSGDFSICGYCGVLLVFMENLILRIATDEDREQSDLLLVEQVQQKIVFCDKKVKSEEGIN